MLQHPLRFALYLGVPINRSRDQPAPSISLFSLCTAPVCWRHSLETPPICLPNHHSKFFSQWTRQKWRLGGTSVPSLLAQEDVTILKWSGNIRGAECSGKGVCHPQHWGSMLAAQPRVVGVGTTEGIVNWKVSPSLRHYHRHYCIFSICLIQSSRGLSEGCDLNKYLHLFQVGRKKKVDHNDSLQVCTTQGVRHKFTCGKQAIHRCNPRNTRVIKSLIYAR